MANTTPSPNMGMPIPTVGEDPGSDWATNVNASLSIVDSHTHTTGQGVPITPAALDINAELPMNNNNLTTTRTVRFYAQAATLSAPDVGCLYEVGDDLYYNDGSGNVVRITQSGSVSGSSGTITGLPSGTASASFAAGTFTFNAATSTPAALAVGPVTIGRSAVGTKTVTLQGNAAQGSNYNLTFPTALPTSTNFVTLDSSGQISPVTAGTTGTGAVVLATSPTLTTPSLSSATLTAPTITSATISSPAISSPTFSGTSAGTITAAAFTPTPVSIAGTVNSVSDFFYTRINNFIQVTGSFNFDSDGTSIFQATFTLPILPSVNFSTATQVNGGFFCKYPAGTSTLQINVSYAEASIGAKTAILTARGASTIVTFTNVTAHVTFGYRLI